MRSRIPSLDLATRNKKKSLTLNLNYDAIMRNHHEVVLMTMPQTVRQWMHGMITEQYTRNQIDSLSVCDFV